MPPDGGGGLTGLRPRRPILLAALILGGVALALAAWVAVDLVRARDALTSARDQAEALSARIGDGDLAAPDEAVRRLQEEISHAEDITSGPAWSLAGRLPLIGPDLRAMAKTTEALDGISARALPVLVEVLAERDRGLLQVEDGAVDLDAISALGPPLAEAADSLDAGRGAVGDALAEDPHGPVRDLIQEVADQIDTAGAAARSAERAAELAPAMLGADGPRRYLLIVQNNAEARSTGGLPGAFALVRAVDGKVTLQSQGAASDLDYFDPPVLPVTADEQALYGSHPTIYWGDANFTPDYPRTAEILRAMYRKRFGAEVDGVLSVDPVALAHLLAATGPVRLPGAIELSASNAVSALLNEVYLRYPADDQAQNRFFNATASAVFSTVVSGRAEPVALLTQLITAVNQGRILVNATDSGEQALLSGTRIAGELPTSPDARPEIGLYLNDSTAAKLQYYLRRDDEVGAVDCAPDGTQTYRIRTALRSAAPKNIAAESPSIVGIRLGAKKGVQRLVVNYYAPAGGRVSTLAVDGKEITVSHTEHNGLDVATVTVDLAPGERHLLEAEILGAPGTTASGVFRTTPGVQDLSNYVPLRSHCGAE